MVLVTVGFFQFFCKGEVNNALLKVNKIETLKFAVSDSEYEAVQFLFLHLSPDSLAPMCDFCPSLSVLLPL